MSTQPASAKDLLTLDAEVETGRICDALRGQVSGALKRRGVVLGLSGGIDSSVCPALGLRALRRNV